MRYAWKNALGAASRNVVELRHDALGSMLVGKRRGQESGIFRSGASKFLMEIVAEGWVLDGVADQAGSAVNIPRAPQETREERRWIVSQRSVRPVHESGSVIGNFLMLSCKKNESEADHKNSAGTMERFRRPFITAQLRLNQGFAGIAAQRQFRNTATANSDGLKNKPPG